MHTVFLYLSWYIEYPLSRAYLYVNYKMINASLKFKINMALFAIFVMHIVISTSHIQFQVSLFILISQISRHINPYFGIPIKKKHDLILAVTSTLFLSILKVIGQRERYQNVPNGKMLSTRILQKKNCFIVSSFYKR